MSNKILFVFFALLLNFLMSYGIDGTESRIAVSNPRVVIIGGGVSGLAAASKLISNGLKNVMIIEANNRLGGRVHTIPFQNRHIEMGAQWIHGQVGNPVFNILKSLNQIDPVETYPETTVYYATQDGVAQSESYVEKILNKLDDAFDELEDKIEAQDPSPSVSVGTFLDKAFNKIVSGLNNPDLNLLRAIYNGKLNDERVDYAIDSFYELSAQGYNEFEDFAGEQNTNIKNGYNKLLEYLSSNIPQSSIKLNEEVKNVDWTNSEVKITSFNKLENSFKTYTADIVLTTSSLGFLKANHRNLFTPQLPDEKVKAIEQVGFGTMDKVFLVFDKPVFSQGEAGLQVFWKGDIPFLDSKYNLNGNKFYKGLNSFYVAPNMPHVLFAFLVGSEANYAENLSDTTLLNIIYDVLTTSFPKLNLPRPVQIIRSKWNNDPYAKGSYSYYKVGSTYDSITDLAKPVKKRLYFAGEGTSPQYISTVHGAYVTGVNAANKIVTAVTI